MKPSASVTRLVRDTRPQPPRDPRSDFGTWFAPDQDGLGDWVHRTFIAEDGVLTNPRHAHLEYAEIGWLWTSAEHKDRNRTALGMCQLVPPAQAKWSSARTQFQLAEWFGTVPDFVITISAVAAVDLDDWSFCALIEHELSHAAQDMLNGFPRFTKEGYPVFRVVGHDVEEFVDVVARYGADATGTRELVTAANAGPTIGAAQMTMACGTCAGASRSIG